MLAQQRKEYIIEMIQKNNVVKVTTLSEILKISEVTIRRDLKELEEAGLLRRTHGGAMKNTSAAFEPQIGDLEREHVEEKTAIARAGYEFIKDNDAIIIDSSSTAAMLAHLIKEGDKRNITVVTNSFKTAWDLMDADNIELIHIGGQLRKNIYSSIGSIAENALKSLRVDKAFIGINGIDFEVGCTTPNMFESQIKRAMIQSSQQVFMVADSSKFNKTYLSIVCDLSDVDYLITDDDVSEEIRARAADFGVELVAAECVSKHD